MKTSHNKFAFLEKESPKEVSIKIEKQDYKMMCMCWI